MPGVLDTPHEGSGPMPNSLIHRIRHRIGTALGAPVELETQSTAPLWTLAHLFAPDLAGTGIHPAARYHIDWKGPY